MKKIDKNMRIGEILQIDARMAPILLESGMHCLGCPSSQIESLADACIIHSIDPDELIEKLNGCVLSENA